VWQAVSDPDFTYDAFLSHSSKDKAVVRAIAIRLKEAGLRLWFDEWVLKPGDNIPAMIEEGLEHSRVLVLCMSANAFGADWARLEANTFRFRDPLNKERRFIPVRFDDAPIRGSLVQFVYVSWIPEDREREFPKLVEACRPLATPAAQAQTEQEQVGDPSGTVYKTGSVGFETRTTDEAQLESTQDEIGPSFLGHRKRDRRYSTTYLSEASRVAALIRVDTGHGELVLLGKVRDVSGGEGERFGRGIHIHIGEWALRCQHGTEPHPPRAVIARNLVTKTEATFLKVALELSFPRLRKLYCAECYCVRVFTYNTREQLSGGGIVLYMRSVTEADLSEWRAFLQAL